MRKQNLVHIWPVKRKYSWSKITSKSTEIMNIFSRFDLIVSDVCPMGSKRPTYTKNGVRLDESHRKRMFTMIFIKFELKFDRFSHTIFVILGGFLTILDHFRPFWTVFGPFWIVFGVNIDNKNLRKHSL